MMKTIEKSIQINAPRAAVWEVLLQEPYISQWYSFFSEGAQAITDWEEGSKVVFTDGSCSGMVGRVAVHKPQEMLSIEMQGGLMNGKEDYDSEDAKAILGCKETYWLTEQEGGTRLSISSGMSEEYYDSMSHAWDQALNMIKDLSEKVPVAI